MKHFLSCLTAACIAVLIASGSTLVLVGSGTLASAKSPAEPARPMAVPADVAPVKFTAPVKQYAKQEVSFPTVSLKSAAQTTLSVGQAKSAQPAEQVTQVSGEANVSTAPQAPKTYAINSDGTFARRNPVVAAVEKTKNSIVTIRVPRSSGKDMIGTGVIVDHHGFIITNRHVVADAKQVNVVLADDTKIAAEIIVADPRHDLAILRIRTTRKLQPMILAPVDDLMPGETVIAVGHPFGYAHTVSTGVISALGREITMPSGDVLKGLIQTNASINPGNSGGPLLNINGEWIGVTVALREGAQNIAFSINAGSVKNFLKQQLNAARVSGIQHGLQCSEKILGETGNRQRVVVSWFQGEGILCKGDEILQVGTMTVANVFDLERAFWGKKAGEKVQLKIVRQGREMNVVLTVAASNGAGQTSASLPRAVRQPDGMPVKTAVAAQR